MRGPLRPSRVPVRAGAIPRPLAAADGAVTAGGCGPAPLRARPSMVPARPAPDLPPGPGQPLGDAVRQEMEDRLGADFSQVRVHTGSAARASAAGFGARAYTVGDHVVIGDGGAGKRVLAHELTHVIQQRQGPVAGTEHSAGVRVSDPSDPFERAAESNAVRAMSLAGPLHVPGQLAGGQPVVVTSASRTSPAASEAGVAVQRFRNPQVPQETIDILHDPDAANINQLPPDQRAQTLLRSGHRVYWYGREPRTDEQIEVLASTKYLHRRRHEWQQELFARGRGAAPNWRAWEHFQSAVASHTPGEPSRPPWFLDPNFGYQVNDAANQGYLGASQHEAANPAPGDPQQLVGATYARDTGLTRHSQNFAPAHRREIGSSGNFGPAAGAVGRVIRLFNDSNPRRAAGELRVRVASVYADATSFTLTGRVIATPHFANFNLAVGGAVSVEGFTDNSLRVTRLSDGRSNDLPGGGWSAELDSYEFYRAVVLSEDALGLRRQDTTTDRNRGMPRQLDDALLAGIVNRYTAISPLSYGNALGPSRNPLNIQDLGWNIVVASYRRLGGDAIFTEAAHPGRNPARYSNVIQPPGAVDVTDPSWYFRSQEHNPDRFVGGRSNSTLLYMQTASMLYQLGNLTLAECLDVAAFVIADMVVSGEHSMPECMTTVAMVAPASPPWSQQASLRIDQPTETLTLWLRLVDQGTRQAMYNETVQALTTYLANNSVYHNQFDFALLKVLVALGKQLFNSLL
jgi:Domain of unknown function (DUF4157)